MAVDHQTIRVLPLLDELDHCSCMVGREEHVFRAFYGHDVVERESQDRGKAG
jgi:hypothetical protein